MKRLMSLILVLMMLTTISNYANTAVTISETITNETAGVMSFIEKENTILTGAFEKYKNDTLYIQLDQYEYETSIYDPKGEFKNLIGEYNENDKIIVYVGYGEATFQLLTVLPKDSQEFTGQIKSIDEENYDILSGDIVEKHQLLNNDRNFVKDQFIEGYVSDEGAYLMPTINLSNQDYNSFGELIEKNITINEKTLIKNSKSIDGVLMIPLRETLEALGYEVQWNNDTRSVELQKSNQWTSIKINENSYFKNKMAHQPLSHAPVIIDGSTYIPVEFLNVIIDLGLSVESGNLTVTENQMVIHSGYIQKIDYNENGKISMTLSSKEMPDTLSDLIIIHASTDTTYFNSTLAQGKLIHVISPPIMTMSLPGQTSGVVIY